MRALKLFGISSLLFVALQVKAQDPVVMTVNGKPVLKSEFEAIFRKNQKDAKVTKEALDEYIGLYTKFKLKVTEAEELGLDTVKKFRDELAGYRKQLARPYLVDNQMTDKLVQEAYDRLKEEVRASHILVKCDWEAEPKDTLAAYNKAMNIRKRTQKEDFGKVASQKGVNEDTYAASQKGDLGWFTAFNMVYFFESACYNMKVGDVSMPVRTKFGYHIIKLTGRRPARGSIKVAQILIASPAEDTPENKEKARKKADEIRQRLEKGEDFAQLARNFSDDPATSKKGGEMAPFSTGKMVDSFEDAAFALKKDGEISGIVETSLGFHIIKRLELKPLDSFEDMKLQLKQKVQKDSRSFLPTKSFIAKLKLKYNFKEDLTALRALYNVVDTNIYNGKWNSDKAKGMSAFMFGFANKTYTQTDYVNFMLKSRPRDRKDIPVLLNAMYDKMVNAMLTEYEDSRLEEQYPEFRLLMKEYRDGILLFELTDKKVWSKAVKDSAGLAQYYEGHKNNYMWPKRWDVDVFMCANSVIAKSLRKDLKKKKDGLTVKGLEEKYNKESQLNLRVVSGKFNAEENEIVKQHLPAAPGLSADISHDGQVIIIRCNAILEPTPKQLSDAKGVITTDYQKYLEDEWIKALQAKYPVVINYDVLYSIK